MSRGALTAVFLVFALLGPIFGGLLFGILLSALAALEDPDLPTALPLLGVLILMPLSYMVGGIQALVAGGVAVWAGRRAGRLSWLPPLGAATAMGALVGARSYADGNEGAAAAALLLVTHIGSAALCLGLCRLMLGRPARQPA